MNDEQFQDLKQFIEATVSQTEARLSDRVDSLSDRVDHLEKKMDNGFAGVGDAIAIIHDLIEENDKATDRRLTKLEERLAA